MTPSRTAVAVSLIFLLSPPIAVASEFRTTFDNVPGNRLFMSANELHRAGDYPTALHQYHSAAHWANKRAQYNIGVHHARGLGTTQDLALAWAWVSLSAERGYPALKARSDFLWELLSGEQRAHAVSILNDELLPLYGDAVALPRTVARMRRARQNATGTRTGSIGTMRVITRPKAPDAPDGTRDAAIHFAKTNWDMERLLEYEARAFRLFRREVWNIDGLEILE